MRKSRHQKAAQRRYQEHLRKIDQAHDSHRWATTFVEEARRCFLLPTSEGRARRYRKVYLMRQAASASAPTRPASDRASLAGGSQA